MAGSLAFAGNDNKLTREEKAAGWELLWDGETFEGWAPALNGRKIEDGWYIEDGELRTRKFEGDRKTIVDIRTSDWYDSFILTLQVKITECANSGIKYFIQYNSNIGCEYQILDDKHHPDAEAGVGGNRKFASLYDLIPADQSKVNFSVGGWNDVKIVVNGNHVEHWLNGELVVDYYRNNQMFDALVNCSKFAKQKGFGTFRMGHILLQNHKDEVAFKNIKLRKI